jgi:hypothetical protein
MLERSADTVPTLTRRNPSALAQRESAIGVPFLWRKIDGAHPHVATKKNPSAYAAWGPQVVASKVRLILAAGRGVGGCQRPQSASQTQSVNNRFRSGKSHWRVHGPKVLDVLAEKYPQAYFSGLVALSKVIKWDAGEGAMFDQTLTPEEIMDKLEQRVGPEGRKLFERFLRQVNKLQAKQYLEAQAQTGDCGGG